MIDQEPRAWSSPFKNVNGSHLATSSVYMGGLNLPTIQVVVRNNCVREEYNRRVYKRDILGACHTNE